MNARIEDVANLLVEAIELDRPRPSDCSAKQSAYQNCSEMYKKLAEKSAEKLLSPLVNADSGAEKTRYGAVFMGYGYYIGAIQSHGHAISLTHQLHYQDSPVWEYHASRILNIDAENTYYANEYLENDVDKLTDEQKRATEIGEFLEWFVNPKGNSEVFLDVMRKICYPMIREVASKLPPRSKKEIALYVPPIAETLDAPNWEAIFEELHIENTVIIVMNHATLYAPDAGTRKYISYYHQWDFGNCCITQAVELSDSGKPVLLQARACLQSDTEAQYEMKGIREMRVTLHGQKPVGDYTECQHDQITTALLRVESILETHEGAQSFLGSRSASFGLDFYSVRKHGKPTTEFQRALWAVFDKDTIQVKTACAKLCRQTDMRNVSLGDLVSVGIALDNQKLFQRTTVSTGQIFSELGTSNKLIPTVNMRELLSLPANYSEMKWKCAKQAYSKNAYMNTPEKKLTQMSVSQQIELMLAHFQTASTIDIADELLFIHGNKNDATALFVARLFVFLSEGETFVVQKLSDPVEEFCV